jgi:hypothetical protein
MPLILSSFKVHIMSQAGSRILVTISGDADIAGGGLELALPALPRSALVMYHIAASRSLDAVLRHDAVSPDGLLIPLDTGAPSEFQSGPWVAGTATRVITSAGTLTLTVTVILLKALAIQ